MDKIQEKGDRIYKGFGKFFNEYGSKNLKLQSIILKDLGSKQLSIYFKSIGFATTVVGSIGLIAGFGFTAFQYIQCVALFFMGEGFLLGALFFGLFWIQSRYQEEFSSLEEERSKLITFYDGRNEILINIVNDYISNQSFNKDDLEKLRKKDNDLIKIFKPEPENDKQIPLIYPKAMYILMIIGAVILFSSFFIKDFLYFILK